MGCESSAGSKWKKDLLVGSTWIIKILDKMGYFFGLFSTWAGQIEGDNDKKNKHLSDFFL